MAWLASQVHALGLKVGGKTGYFSDMRRLLHEPKNVAPTPLLQFGLYTSVGPETVRLCAARGAVLVVAGMRTSPQRTLPPPHRLYPQCSSGNRTHPIPGSYGHYEHDALTFAAWGVDEVTLDW